MAIRMTQVVFLDEHGVVHYREFEPFTWCGISIIGQRGTSARSVHIGEGLPLSRRTELPEVTCMICLATAEDP